MLVCSKRLSDLAHVLGSDYQVVAEVEGSSLEGGLYTNPLWRKEERVDGGAEETLPFLPGDHVTATSGTGLVHTAPAHGLEDYHVGMKHGLTLVRALQGAAVRVCVCVCVCVREREGERECVCV